MKYTTWIRSVLMLVMLSVQATPYLPDDDAQILARLPDVLFEKTTQNFRDKQQSAIDMNQAIQLSQQYIQQSRNTGDPRYLGRAEAVLSPWWNNQRASVPVLVMRAILRQANHEFDLALLDLNAAIQLDPANAQARLTRASVLQVRGDYSQAYKDCRQLAVLQQYFVAQVCLAEIASMRGRASQATQLLKQLRVQLADTDINNRQWIDGLLAEIMQRQDDTPTAEKYYIAAITVAKPDMYLLTAYADFLLDQNRPREVIQLLKPYQSADAALLRLAIAANIIQHPHATIWKADLHERFVEARLRGSTLHQREEARFTLVLLQQPAAALKLAHANWLMQHEPVDARLLLEAALAAGNPEAAQPVLGWLQTTGMQDVHLQALRHKLLAVTQASIK